jgi:squalene-hopene/tetraprenyl-beta-curcumene cyclase
MLGLDLGVRRERIVRYLLSRQNADGSWGIAQAWDGDVSSTVEVYLALRILDLDTTHPALARAEKFILRSGGLEKVRIFTRIFMAMFGLFPWSAIPIIPPEFILLPVQSPVNIYRLASWARGTMVPLFVIFHHRPVFALPNGRSSENPWLDHLWVNPRDKRVPYSSSVLDLTMKHGLGWKAVFGTADVLLRVYERTKVGALRDRALQQCTRWILDRQEETGDWAGIFPPMINSILALTLQGYGLESEPVRKGLEAIENFSWEDKDGFRIQACQSPVWDTALSAISLIDSGVDRARESLQGAVRWVLERQLLVDYGDWKVYRPDLEPGGWSFEYSNSWYPDVDDTAAVVLMMLKQDPDSANSALMRQALRWVLGMQNRDGGWAAFDVDNDKIFLNEIPFSDMGSLCDPSTPDVTGRVLEAMGHWLHAVADAGDGDANVLRAEVERACELGVLYLRRSQEEQGSWYGRWGVNYVYGTSNVLCGLAQLGLPASDPMIDAALNWLKHVQNRDGGWGESVASYADSRWMGRGVSTPSQTAWGLMGLLSFAAAPDPAIESGVAWLVRHQIAVPHGGTWEEEHSTGTGFPNHFYLRYHLYRHYFPMMALGRYMSRFAQ